MATDFRENGSGFVDSDLYVKVTASTRVYYQIKISEAVGIFPTVESCAFHTVSVSTMSG